MDLVRAHRSDGLVIFDDWRTSGRRSRGIVAYARDRGLALSLIQSWLLGLGFIAFAWLRPTAARPK